MNKAVIRLLQKDLPLEERPFKVLAEEIGITEPELIDEIKKLQESGAIRKFGAILGHRQAGFTSNAMIVFDVPDDQVEAAGPKIASFKEVSHCYERPRFQGFNYNLYAMTHGKSEEEIMGTAEKIARTIGAGSYKLLRSRKEYKKSSPKFF